MSTQTYQERSAAAQAQIYSTGYYTNRYEACLKKHGMTRIDVEKKLYTAPKLHALWEEFWWQLPDSPSIRVEPFFMICDLCEDPDLNENVDI